ncbi:MAG: triose-phosphate isomerase [Dehalococcoidia bacterium]|nr:MAG: triose-phosphate isomerase [Dehalococcoidia bacterium]
MRIPLIAANWKMNTNIREAVELVYQLVNSLDRIKGVEKVICPPYISLGVVGDIIRNSSIYLGAQNMHYEEKGAYTGEISPLMLDGLCQFVLIGHSERRQYFNDTDDIINKKIKTALNFKIKPILCVGEKLAENEAGKTTDIVSYQLELALSGLNNLDGIVIAYEPIWAIGTGRSATNIQAGKTIGYIRRKIASLHNEIAARKLRILYGGSVSADNISGFIKEPEIDGALVGGASLNIQQFTSIVEQTAETIGS